MKRFLSLLLATGVGISLAPGTAYTAAAPLYCTHPPKRGLTPDQQANCDNPEKAKRREQEENQLSEPKYPFEFAYLGMLDPATGNPIAVRINSEDGATISITDFKTRESLYSFPSKNIATWKITQGATGTDSSAAVGAIVGGALFFWPMLLAAPFMVRNYSIMNFQVSYVDDYGNDRQIAFYTGNSPKPVMELLRFSSNLEAGTQRNKAELDPLYRDGLQRSMIRLDTLQKQVEVVNPRKPWCSYLDLSKDTLEVKSYKTALSEVNAVRTSLSLPEYTASTSTSSADKWKEYLASNDAMRKWAQANPSQASKLSNC